jgi:hypothetical protein
MSVVTGILCILMSAAYAVLAGLYPDAGWLQHPMMRVAWPAGVALLCIAGLFAARPLNRRDPLLVVCTFLGLVGCLLLMPLAIARDQQAVSDVRQQARIVDLRKQLKVRQLQLEQIRREEAADRAERAKSDRFVRYEGRIPAATLEQLRALDGRMTSQVQDAANSYQAALKANPTKGPDSWLRFRSLDQVEAEWAAHKALYEQTRAFTQFIEGFEERYTREIEDLALQPPADRVAIAEMERVLQYWRASRVYDLRQLDVHSLAAALQALSILRDDWGQWSYNPRENQLLFQDAAREAAFYQALQTLQQIATEVRDISGNLPGDS